MKGEKMLIGLSYIDRKFIDESENDTVSGKKLHDSSKQEANISMKRTLKRPLLIAAIITLMLFLMGCAAVVLLHLNDLKIGERTYTQHPLYLEDGTKTPATEKVKEIISVQGVAESPNQQAAKEWYEFTKAYDIVQKYPDGIPDFTAPDAYDSYWVPTQELVDKVDEICKKYDLKLVGEGALLLTQAEEAGEEMGNEPKMQAQMMVPLREAAKENGYTVKWQGKQKPIVLEKDGTSIEITLGSAEYVVEGDMVMKAAMPSELKDGKTYVSSEIFN